jgi:hypothetical protein
MVTSFALAITHEIDTALQASIIITPHRRAVQKEVTFQAVTGTPSPQQLQARRISATIAPQTLTVPATKTVQVPTLQAQGSITFLNIFPQWTYVASQSILMTKSGIRVETLAQAQIPPGTGPTQGRVTVPARAIDAGVGGNIPAYALNSTQCCDNGIINGVVALNEQPFTGGQDAASYVVVQQSDITNTSTLLIQQMKSQEQAAIQAQIHPGERLVASSCTPSSSSSVRAETKASQVTVTTTDTCTGEVYSQRDAEYLAQRRFIEEQKPASGTWHIDQIGAIKVSVQQAVQGTLALSIPITATWTAYIDRQAVERALHQVTGQPRDKAKTLLMRVTGIEQIQFSGNFGDTLPGSSSNIGYTIRS